MKTLILLVTGFLFLTTVNMQAQDSSRPKSGKYSSRSRNAEDTTRTKAKTDTLGIGIDVLIKGELGEGKPLIVIDGIVYTDQDILNSLNPDDIDSISILKEETAVRIYGEKGKNGVIIITTKSNKEKNKKDSNKPATKKKRKKLKKG
jgi:TonB-dependent SusC/RagA subfamily outer membrane receptor